ncbi:MAG TPA: GNAT family N-acetyltransferase [Chthoniobacterales bacterium]|jgi:ribosomal protein S18 acetylase RimI-like enzyme
MKLAQWVRFTWDLEKLPPTGVALPPHYNFSAGGPDDETELRAVITRAFAHDNSWGRAIHEINGMIDGWLERAFAEENAAPSVVLRHGLRIIGAAILIPEDSAEDHLLPGPCVLMEYRNRGFGTALLGESLRQLREAGLTRAGARARDNALVAKFLYPKFDGTPTPDDTPLLAA